MQCSLIEINEEVVERYGWRDLVKSKKFDYIKAAQSLEVSEPGYLSAVKPKTLEAAITMPTPALSTLMLYRGEILTNGLIHKIVYQIRDFFSVGRQLTDDQVEVLCDVIYENYYWMTVAELKYFVRKCMSAAFGKVFDRLDGDTIMQWLLQYSDEVLEARRKVLQQKEQEARKLAEQGEKKPLPTEFVDRMTAMFARWEARAKKRTVKMEFTSLEQYCKITKTDYQKLIAEIEKIAKENFEQSKVDFPNLDFDQYLHWNKAVTLAEINKKWAKGVEVEIEE